MASIYDLKPAFQGLLRPLCRALARFGVTANQVTIAAVLLSLAAGGLVAARPLERWPLLLVPAVLFVRMALNAIDGMLAREHGMKSALGGILNELGDVISDAALYLPLARVPGIAPWAIVIAVLLAGLTEMTGVVAVQIGASRRYDGPMGKSDRAFVFGVICLALGVGAPVGGWIDFVLGAILAALVLTVANRARQALREVRSRGHQDR
ncbi:MAG TPA: CDP-alcohol phosphatidyltransferase family protein [Thermoanaerobaculia bacterium]|nr:CDP-alcohol phosphatidyltransferase family protein [Thermoanaerobaculia bacterium]